MGSTARYRGHRCRRARSCRRGRGTCRSAVRRVRQFSLGFHLRAPARPGDGCEGASRSYSPRLFADSHDAMAADLSRDAGVRSVVDAARDRETAAAGIHGPRPAPDFRGGAAVDRVPRHAWGYGFDPDRRSRERTARVLFSVSASDRLPGGCVLVRGRRWLHADREIPVSDFTEGNWSEHVRALRSQKMPEGSLRSDGAEVCTNFLLSLVPMNDVWGRLQHAAGLSPPFAAAGLKPRSG